MGRTLKAKSGPSRARRPAPPDPAVALPEAVPSLDAEDIALARLQAQLRRKETLTPPRGGALARAMIRLPTGLLAKAKRRAQQDGVPLSEIVQRALEKFLR
jgi:hypothetical protein